MTPDLAPSAGAKAERDIPSRGELHARRDREYEVFNPIQTNDFHQYPSSRPKMRDWLFAMQNDPCYGTVSRTEQ